MEILRISVLAFLVGMYEILNIFCHKCLTVYHK